MKIISILFVFSLMLSSEQCADAQKRKNNSQKNAAQEKVQVENLNESRALKILTEDAQSNAEEPFVFVARDAQTYANLQKLFQNLPAANSINFKTTAVVAAFAGTKPTPGYKIVFSQNASGLRIDLTAPPKDAILAQVLTAPAKVVAVPVAENDGLAVELSQTWQTAATVYRVTSAQFEQSGGIAGKVNKFSLTGTISVFRFNNLATAIFNLNGANADKNKRVSTVASGTVDNNQVTFTDVDLGTLVETPHPAVTAKGTIADKNLSLTFEPGRPTVADGFTASGKIEANR